MDSPWWGSPGRCLPLSSSRARAPYRGSAASSTHGTTARWSCPVPGRFPTAPLPVPEPRQRLRHPTVPDPATVAPMLTSRRWCIPSWNADAWTQMTSAFSGLTSARAIRCPKKIARPSRSCPNVRGRRAEEHQGTADSRRTSWPSCPPQRHVSAVSALSEAPLADGKKTVSSTFRVAPTRRWPQGIQGRAHPWFTHPCPAWLALSGLKAFGAREPGALPRADMGLPRWGAESWDAATAPTSFPTPSGLHLGSSKGSPWMPFCLFPTVARPPTRIPATARRRPSGGPRHHDELGLPHRRLARTGLRRLP